MELLLEQGVSSLLVKVNSFLHERNTKAYLVGGFVRDTLLGRETADIDIALTADALEITPDIAGALGGKFLMKVTEYLENYKV